LTFVLIYVVLWEIIILVFGCSKIIHILNETARALAPLLAYGQFTPHRSRYELFLLRRGQIVIY
jgi:hypothetical protein